MNILLKNKSTSASAYNVIETPNPLANISRDSCFFSRANTLALLTTVTEDLSAFLTGTTSGVALTVNNDCAKPNIRVNSEPKLDDDTQKSINKLRKLSGLTWEQLSQLLNVSRRTLHFWASGQKINSNNEEKLNRLLGVIEYIDKGSASLNRALLFKSTEDGKHLFDLLVDGKYQEVKDTLGLGNIPVKPKLKPLSEDARKSRKPLSPESLVDALPDSIEPVKRGISRSRPAKSIRRRKK